MEFKREYITPASARLLLDKNLRNRKVDENRVSLYASDMTEGRWKDNTAEVIKISKTNVILDGQHRLHAVIKANISFHFHVVSGLEDSIFDVLDTGKIRTSSDVFDIEKITNGGSIASMIKTYLAFKKGNGASSKIANVVLKSTNTVLLEMYREKPEYWQSVHKFAIAMYKAYSGIMSYTTIGAFYSYLNDIDSEQSRDFLRQLCTGQDIENSSILVLRNLLLKDKLSNKKLGISDKNALVIKTWNAYRLNRVYKVISFVSEKENYPTPL